jgi:hypothetical protein
MIDGSHFVTDCINPVKIQLFIRHNTEAGDISDSGLVGCVLLEKGRKNSQ